jgi:dTDP-4-dehydrorhamnose reductase
LKVRAVVTGASGLLGSRLCRLLTQRGHTVLGICRRAPAQLGHLWVAECDLSDPKAAQDALTAGGPELIFHTAGLMDPEACEADPDQAYASNVQSAANVASVARRLGAHLVLTSTDYLFDGAAGPYREDDVPNPRGVYPLTRHAAEQVVRALCPSATIARTAVVYGWPADYRMNFGAWLVESLRAGREVRLFEDQWVTPTWATHAAEMIGELGERRLEGIWHTAGGEVVDRVTFGRALCEMFGFDARLVVPCSLRDAPFTAPRPARAGLVTQKAQAQLQAKPLGLQASLERFLGEVRAEGGA